MSSLESQISWDLEGIGDPAACLKSGGQLRTSDPWDLLVKGIKQKGTSLILLLLMP